MSDLFLWMLQLFHSWWTWQTEWRTTDLDRSRAAINDSATCIVILSCFTEDATDLGMGEVEIASVSTTSTTFMLFYWYLLINQLGLNTIQVPVAAWVFIFVKRSVFHFSICDCKEWRLTASRNRHMVVDYIAIYAALESGSNCTIKGAQLRNTRFYFHHWKQGPLDGFPLLIAYRINDQRTTWLWRRKFCHVFQHPVAEIKLPYPRPLSSGVQDEPLVTEQRPFLDPLETGAHRSTLSFILVRTPPLNHKSPDIYFRQ